MSGDLAALRAAAVKATPGPWIVDYPGDFGAKSAHIADVLRERYGDNALDFGEDHDTARYVAAASPAVVLQLLDRIEELERRLGDG